MTFLPVVQRELRVSSRRGATFWGRSLAALIAIGAGIWIYVFNEGSAMASLGMTLFMTLSGFVFTYSFFAGMVYSADTVSSEKREGTLGLLFLTDLRGYDVVLGKLAASSVAAIYRVLAVLPVIAIALLLGGVTAAEYWRMVVVLLVTLLLSLGAGMLASVVCVNSKSAAGLTFALLACAGFLSLLVAALLAWILPKFGWSQASIEDRLGPWLGWESPVMAFISAFSVFPSKDRWIHYPGVAWTAGLGAVFLAIASWRLPHSWHDASTDRVRRGFMSAVENWWLRGDAGRLALRRRLLALGPISWLNGRHVGRSLLVWAALGLVALTYATFGSSLGWKELGFHVSLSMAAHAMLKFWVASEAPRRFFEDRRSGAMELYLCTPLTVQGILADQLRSLRSLFMGPIIAVLGSDLLILAMAGKQSGSDSSFVTFWLLRTACLPLDAITMGYVGMWLGMSSTTSRTTGGVVWRVIVIPWLICVGLLTLGMVTQAWRLLEKLPLNSGLIILWAWFAIGALNNAYWLAHSRLALKTQFRELATLPTGRRRKFGWWRRRVASDE